MTKEVQDILEGRKKITFKFVNYNTPERKEELKAVIKAQKEVLERKEVDWQKLNTFIIKR
ncbi:MAG: hypothetical protein EHM93_06555 [Bacteroidales bacterium]|nr:MAG: hypothetical protein EHM93_06555 [Bacteroidales bacterium]